MTDSKDCPVCCETFNKSSRKPVECECSGCDFAACKTCIRAYLLSQTSDPACMSCHKAWSQGFLTTSLNTSFMTKDYRAHRARVLREREQSRLQDSVQDAQRFLEGESLAEKVQVLDQTVAELKRQLTRASNDRMETSTRRHALLHGMDVESQEAKEKRQFIMPCPAPDCRGFLSTQWKCGLCDVFGCKACFEVIGHQKDAPHTCKPDNVASAEAIRKDTKPCPACGVRIYKLSGCDQMWCTQCHISFSYRTGNRTNSAVHNPHYLEWQRANKDRDGAAVRAVGDVYCGGLPEHYDINYGLARRIQDVDDWVSYVLKKPSWYSLTHTEAACRILGYSPKLLRHGLLQLFRVAGNVVGVLLPRMREQVQRLEDCGPIRVQYLLKRLSEGELEKQVFAQDAKRRKTLQVLHVMELLGAVLTETFNDMANFCRHGVDDAKTEQAAGVVAASRHGVWIAQSERAMEAAAPVLKTQCGLTFDPATGRSCNVRSYFCAAMIADSMERMDQLIDYCNAQLAQISVAFSLSVPKLLCRGYKWRWSPECPALEKTLVEGGFTNILRRWGCNQGAAETTLYDITNYKYTGTEASDAQRVADALGEAPVENVKV